MPKQAEANLSALIESTEDLIWSVDLDNRLLTINRAFMRHFEETFGVRLAVGMRPQDMVPPERVDLMPALYERVRAEGSCRVEFVLANGRILELFFNPIVVDGKTIGISVFGKDVTQRKAAEEERHFLAEVVESCEEAIFTNAPSTAILTWNRAAESIYGYTAAEAIGQPFAMIIAPEMRERAARQINELLAGAPRLLTEGVALRKDGGRTPVSVLTWGIRNLVGEVTALATIVRDISLRNEVEKNRALLASVVESSEDAIVANDSDGKIVSWNRGAEQLLGYTRAEAIGQEVAMLAVAGHEEILRQHLSLVHSGYPIGSFDGVLRHKDGHTIDISLSVSPILGLNGKAIGGAAIARDIGQRKQFERALYEAEQKYRAIFDGALEGIFQISTASRPLRVNRALARMLGYDSPEDLLSWVKDASASIWVDAEERTCHMRKIREQGAVLDFECQFKRKDGSIVLVSLSTRKVCGSDGEVLCYEGSVLDITGRKRAEMQLRESEERYRATFEQAAVGIVHTSFEGQYLRCNARFAQIIGYPIDEVPGLSYQQTTVPEDLDSIDLPHLQAWDGAAESFSAEKRYIRKDGSLVWARVTLSPQRDSQGRTEYVIGIVEEIQARKQAEQRLGEAVNALRLSEERYRTAFQTSLDAININRIDDGRFIDCNQSFLDSLGYTREEVLGRTSKDLRVWADPRDRDKMIEILYQTSGCRGLEAQFRKKNGEVAWGEISASKIEIDGVACVLTVTRDLSSAKAAENTIRSLAFYDPLTGLPNRRMLLERLRVALDAGGRSQALLLVDLDNFKTLNETLGHQTGDLLLQQVARRIAACAREADSVFRLGGDEFVMILGVLSDVPQEAATQAQEAGEKILAAIDHPCRVDDRECHLTASIGMTLFGGRKQSTDEILQQTDIALDQAKAAGRNAMRFFSPALQAAVNARAQMEEELRQAIKEKQFLLYYQPQVERGRLTGAEVLIRWRHPRCGLVLPDEFIPLAEESRLILPLGEWVLGAACEQIALWAGRKHTAHLAVAVNISALQFRQPEFVAQVLQALDRTAANPKNLKLELTESMLVENIDEVIAKMNELKSHGVSFSLDDFGTGYSSLAYLKRLPLDQLKIDRAFVHDMLVDATSGAIAQTVIALGRAMGLSVIAEGVESEEQRGFLAGLGCHAFQGFLFSRPLPLKDFQKFLKNFAGH